MADVPLQVVSDVTGSERRITPSWSISQLKSKLESVTGVPPSAQKLTLKVPGQGPVSIEAHDEDSTTLSNWNLVPYAELHVSQPLPVLLVPR
jgi:tubulin-folding cofactor B